MHHKKYQSFSSKKFVPGDGPIGPNKTEIKVCPVNGLKSSNEHIIPFFILRCGLSRGPYLTRISRNLGEARISSVRSWWKYIKAIDTNVILSLEIAKISFQFIFKYLIILI
jgi:hypothetical protein